MPAVEVTAAARVDKVVDAAVAHHTHSLHQGQHGEGPPDGVVQVGLRPPLLKE